MASAADLSVEMAGLRFKSPILVASSEYGSNVSMLQHLTDRKIGGIVTKTFTSAPDFRIRVRPYQFPLNKFGKAYAEGGCLYSLAAPHVEANQTVQAHVSRMAARCQASSLVLIVSFFEDPQNVDLWIDQASAFEKIGADMLELNFSSLVGIGSAMYFEGPQILDTLHDGISDWMQTKGYAAVSEFQGKALRHIKNPGSLKSEEKYPYTTPPDCPYVPVIDTAVCTLCGTCETTCIYQVFAVDERQSKVFIDENKCWSCGFCVGICPAGAIELRDRQNKDRLIWNNQGVAESFS